MAFLFHTQRTILSTLFFSAWGSEELDGRSLAFWQAGSGLVLDRTTFDEWLLGSAEAAGVTVLRGCRITSARWHEKEWLLSSLMDGSEQALAASFIAEATGRMARSVVQPDVRRFFMDALVCRSVELPERSSDSPIAMVESCTVGWWYTVRLPNGRQTVALFTDADLVEPAETRINWLDAVLKTTSHFRRLADRFPQDVRIHVCDARTSVRNVLWRDSWTRLEMRLGVLIHFQAPALKGPSTMASKLPPRFLGRRLMEIPNNSELMLFHGLMPSANHSLCSDDTMAPKRAGGTPYSGVGVCRCAPDGYCQIGFPTEGRSTSR